MKLAEHFDTFLVDTVNLNQARIGAGRDDRGIPCEQRLSPEDTALLPAR
jgi:hypothetical protein